MIRVSVTGPSISSTRRMVSVGASAALLCDALQELTGGGIKLPIELLELGPNTRISVQAKAVNQV